MIITPVRMCHNPTELIATVARQATTASPFSNETDAALLKYLYKAGHHNVFRFAHMTVRVQDVSRAFMAQITTHKHLAHLSSSQHYQNYSKYPRISYMDDERLQHHFESTMRLYEKLVAEGMPPEEARECLPNSMGVNMFLTANATHWAHILRERLCNRNVKEMRIFAATMHEVLKAWFPDLFNHVGPQCIEGKCKQGMMRCEERYYENISG